MLYYKSEKCQKKPNKQQLYDKRWMDLLIKIWASKIRNIMIYEV